MPEVIKSPRAKLDLLDIWDYIAEDSEVRADNFLDTIALKLQMLSRNPMIGRVRNELVPFLRSFPVGNYIIFYRPVENGIEVIRVLSASRDIDALF